MTIHLGVSRAADTILDRRIGTTDAVKLPQPDEGGAIIVDGEDFDLFKRTRLVADSEIGMLCPREP